VLASLPLLPQSSANLLRHGCLRTLPGAGFAGDGFFAAMFVREERATL